MTNFLSTESKNQWTYKIQYKQTLLRDTVLTDLKLRQQFVNSYVLPCLGNTVQHVANLLHK